MPVEEDAMASLEEAEAEARERRENPTYHTAVWGVLSVPVPGSPATLVEAAAKAGPDFDEMSEGESAGESEDDGATPLPAPSPGAPQNGSLQSGAVNNSGMKRGSVAGSRASAGRGEQRFDPDDNTVSVAARKRFFSLRRELEAVQVRTASRIHLFALLEAAYD